MAAAAKVILFVLAALAANSTCPAFAQSNSNFADTAAQPASNFANAASEAAYMAKMQRIMAVANSTPPSKLSQECNVRAIAFNKAILKYDADSTFQNVLINVGEDYLTAVARYAGCLDKTDAKVRMVNTSDEVNLRVLMMSNGVIPGTEAKFGPALRPTVGSPPQNRRTDLPSQPK